MVFLRASTIAVAISTAVASATAHSMRGLSLMAGDNSTITTADTEAVLAASAPKLYSYCGGDIVGGDIFAKRYPSPDDCVTNCLPSTGCNAGTWTRFEGGTCYFKRVTKAQGALINVVPSGGAVSFLLEDKNTPVKDPDDVLNTDLPGNDFANAPTADTNICMILCRRTERCSAYTYRAGICYMKTKPSPNVALSGAMSAVVAHARNAAACLAYV